MECPACDHPNTDGARYCAKCGALLPPPAADGQDPLIGQVVGGRFRITGLLGEGGMGRVYNAEQQMGTSVRKVAVKTLLKEFSQDSQVIGRFMRECGTVVELEHPNTIKFHDFGQTDAGELYIAMEFVDGKSLADVIEAGPLEADRVDRIMRQICGSLHEAHDKGVVHRDLKPENVILTTRAGEKDFVKVLDFGIAKRSEAADQAREQKLTQAGMVLGTPPYMSPEQFTGKELDQRSDIYSLGVMAYELLTATLPFEANTPWEWATQHMTAQPFPFEKTTPMAAMIPEHMKQAIMRSLAKNADERQTTAKQFYAEMTTGQLGEAAVRAAGTLTGPAPGATTGGATEAFPAGMAPAAAAGAAGAEAVGRPGATQIGEPFMPPPEAAGPPMGAGAPVQASTGPQPHSPAPTGGGQAMPAAAPMPARSSGGGGKGMYIGIAAVVAVLLGIGVVFALAGGSDDDDETDSLIPIPAGDGEESSGGDTVTEDSVGGGSPDTSTGDTSTDTAAETSTDTETKTATKTSTKTKTPTGQDPTTYCNQATQAAMAKNCAAARSAMAKCSGPKSHIARANLNTHCPRGLILRKR